MYLPQDRCSERDLAPINEWHRGYLLNSAERALAARPRSNQAHQFAWRNRCRHHDNGRRGNRYRSGDEYSGRRDKDFKCHIYIVLSAAKNNMPFWWFFTPPSFQISQNFCSHSTKLSEVEGTGEKQREIEKTCSLGFHDHAIIVRTCNL